jgi:hypothetical protein
MYIHVVSPDFVSLECLCITKTNNNMYYIINKMKIYAYNMECWHYRKMNVILVISITELGNKHKNLDKQKVSQILLPSDNK